MKISKGTVKDALINAIKEIQKQSGRTVPEIDEDTCILIHIEGFTSQNLIELICISEEKLGIDLPDGVFFDINDELTVKNLTKSVLDNIIQK